MFTIVIGFALLWFIMALGSETTADFLVMMIPVAIFTALGFGLVSFSKDNNHE